MFLKILGSFLLVIGIVMAVPLALGVLSSAAALLWTVIKVGAVALLIYVGWRWINGHQGAPAWKRHG